MIAASKSLQKCMERLQIFRHGVCITLAVAFGNNSSCSDAIAFINAFFATHRSHSCVKAIRWPGARARAPVPIAVGQSDVRRTSI
jgi:hypothetical protein